MQSLKEIQGWPDGAVVESVQVKVSGVYERKQIKGPSGSVQHATVEDAAGNKMRISVFGHPDLMPLKGGEYILHSTKGQRGLGGVTVKHDVYQGKTTIELNVSKSGQFQHLQVFHAQKTQTGNPEAATAPQTAGTGQEAPKAPEPRNDEKKLVRGDKVGMALKAGVDMAIATTGFASIPEDEKIALIAKYSSRLIKLSCWLEDGNLKE